MSNNGHPVCDLSQNFRGFSMAINVLLFAIAACLPRLQLRAATLRLLSSDRPEVRPQFHDFSMAVFRFGTKFSHSRARRRVPIGAQFDQRVAMSAFTESRHLRCSVSSIKLHVREFPDLQTRVFRERAATDRRARSSMGKTKDATWQATASSAFLDHVQTRHRQLRPQAMSRPPDCKICSAPAPTNFAGAGSSLQSCRLKSLCACAQHDALRKWIIRI